MIIPRHYENLHVLHENTVANRSYYIPAEERFDDLVENREHSGRFQLLNGMWGFRYFDSIYDLKDEFYQEGYGEEGCGSTCIRRSSSFPEGRSREWRWREPW